MSRQGFKSGGWYSRGYLPHFDGGEIPQFVTFRLFDSMPQSVLEQWRKELELKIDADVALRKRIESYLDAGCGECFLRDERIASVVQNALLFLHTKKYILAAWVIMPNHVHLLATPLADFSLAEIMHSIKSFTAKEANKLLQRSGVFWQHESFDRYIRNAKHYEKVIAYIESNPAKAGLCERRAEWAFSSAQYRIEGEQ